MGKQPLKGPNRPFGLPWFLMVVPISGDKNHVYVELKETWPK